MLVWTSSAVCANEFNVGGGEITGDRFTKSMTLSKTGTGNSGGEGLVDLGGLSSIGDGLVDLGGLDSIFEGLVDLAEPVEETA